MAEWEQEPELRGQRGPVATGPRRADPGRRPPGPRLPGRRRRRRKGRIRRLARHPVVRVLAALALAGFCWLSFSVGQALTAPDGGSVSARLAEWARDHYLGPVVTFGEWLTYQPPTVGGKPPFSLAAPSAKPTLAHHRGFVADVPGPLAPFARPQLPGEGVWRLAEAVHGEPGRVRDVPAGGQRAHLLCGWHRVLRPAAGQIPAAPGYAGSRGRLRRGRVVDPARAAGRAAGDVQRRVPAERVGRRLLPERQGQRRAR